MSLKSVVHDLISFINWLRLKDIAEIQLDRLGYNFTNLYTSISKHRRATLWNTSKTFRFIHALAILGIIEIVPHPNNPSLHIRVVEYDKWVGAPDSGKQKKKTVNEKFRLFWNEFHSITQLPKENIAKAQREWKKLSDKEQQLAIDKVEDYYFHQTNINYLLHAASYLSNKAFLNEYW